MQYSTHPILETRYYEDNIVYSRALAIQLKSISAAIVYRECLALKWCIEAQEDYKPKSGRLKYPEFEFDGHDICERLGMSYEEFARAIKVLKKTGLLDFWKGEFKTVLFFPKIREE